jgi:hypothetical protein
MELHFQNMRAKKIKFYEITNKLISYLVYIIYLQNILYKIWHKSKFFFLKASLILQLLNTNKNVFNIGVKYVRMEFVWFFFEKNLMHSNSHPLIPFFTRTHTHTHSHTLTHTHTPSHTLTHTHTPSHTLTHTHTHSNTLTHTFSHS